MPDFSSQSWHREIVELHEFFEGWLSGTLPESAFERLERALDEGFVYVKPGGPVASRPALLEALRAARGASPELKIRIEDAHLQHKSGDLLVATYVEWQPDRSRLSTVVFRRDDAGPNGVRWLHVHESWL